MTPHTVWVVTELYYPEETSTGYLLTCIAEGLASTFPVRVVCGQPTYAKRGTTAARREVRRGVIIERCWSTVLDKNKLIPRLANALTLSLSMFLAVLCRSRRGDVVLVVTNPPFLPFLVALASLLRGAKTALIVHDVYPEALVAAGLLPRRGGLVRLAARVSRWLYGVMDQVVVLGRDMQTLAASKLDGASDKIVVIPNWADLAIVAPADRAGNSMLHRLGLANKFVVQYAGNMGRTHDLETIIDAARALKGDPDFHFLMIGWGAKSPMVERAAREEGLANVTALGPQPRSEQQVFLNACDLAVIAFLPGMSGVSVPSRMYNVMAAGKPILAIADADSELALVVGEHRIGWVVSPGDVNGVLASLRDARAHPERLAEMGRRAREVAERQYSVESSVQLYRELVSHQLVS